MSGLEKMVVESCHELTRFLLFQQIADLKSLSDQMHKFESHYIINLAGNYLFTTK